MLFGVVGGVRRLDVAVVVVLQFTMQTGAVGGLLELQFDGLGSRRLTRDRVGERHGG